MLVRVHEAPPQRAPVSMNPARRVGAYRKQSKRQRLIAELASIQRVGEDRPSWFSKSDYDRLAREFAAKSAELVTLEIAAYRRRVEGRKTF